MAFSAEYGGVQLQAERGSCWKLLYLERGCERTDMKLKDLLQHTCETESTHVERCVHTNNSASISYNSSTHVHVHTL